MTSDHAHKTEGPGPNAIGGGRWILCMQDRATQFGEDGTTKSTAAVAVAYHLLHALGEAKHAMIYPGGGFAMVKACQSMGASYDLTGP